LTVRVFVAGATGAVGQQLVPRLVAARHEVHGMTRYGSKRAMLSALGAVPVVADALDPDQVAEAVGRARPEVIVHQLTAIGALDPRHFDRDFAPTNRLRTEGTDHLLSAGQAVGVRRFVAQSYGAWWYVRTGGPVKSEQDSLDPTPAREMRESWAAIRHLQQAVLGAGRTGGIVLRYGAFYGPGTSMAPGGEQFELVRRRKFPLVGDGGGVWSYIHIADAAEATVAAIEHGRRGVYNIVDDDPAPVAEWLPALAETLGAKQPMRVPRFVGRLFAGEVGVVMMTDARGASNAKAKRELGWQPKHPSWDELRRCSRVAPRRCSRPRFWRHSASHREGSQAAPLGRAAAPRVRQPGLRPMQFDQQVQISVATERSDRAEEEPNANRPGNNQQSNAQTLPSAMNTGDAELISKTIDQTKGGNR
jgi:nucleoside-diphosphate-sugar epimerase